MKRKVYLSGGFALVALVFVFGVNGFSFTDTATLQKKVVTLERSIDEIGGSLLAQLPPSTSSNVTTNPATNVTRDSAVFDATVDFNGLVQEWNLGPNEDVNRISYVYFYEYTNTAGQVIFRSSSIGYLNQDLQNGSLQKTVQNLLPGQEYRYRIQINYQKADGTRIRENGNTVAFTTSAVPSNAPNAITLPALNVTQNSATFDGEVDLNGANDFYGLVQEWGLNGNEINSIEFSYVYRHTDIVTGQVQTQYAVSTLLNPALQAGSLQKSVTNLIPDTTYQYYIRVNYRRSNGTTFSKTGNIETFTTPSSSSNVVTLPATSVSHNTAVFDATVNLASLINRQWGFDASDDINNIMFIYQYWYTDSYGRQVLRTTNPFQGLRDAMQNNTVQHVVQNLVPGTQYRYRIQLIYRNPDGSYQTAFGNTEQFTTSTDELYGTIQDGGLSLSHCVFPVDEPVTFTKAVKITALHDDIYIDKRTVLGNSVTTTTGSGIVYNLSRASGLRQWESLADGTLAHNGAPVLSVVPVVASDLINLDADPGYVYPNPAIDMGTSIKIPAGQTGHIILKGTINLTNAGYHLVRIYKIPFNTDNSSNYPHAFVEGDDYQNSGLVDIFTVGGPSSSGCPSWYYNI